MAVPACFTSCWLSVAVPVVITQAEEMSAAPAFPFAPLSFFFFLAPLSIGLIIFVGLHSLG